MMLLLVCKRPPEDSAVRELVDIALMATLFNQAPTLLLLGDGVLNLRAADSPLAELQDLLTSSCLVDAGALPDRDAGPAVLDSEILNEGALRALFTRADQVVML